VYSFPLGKQCTKPPWGNEWGYPKFMDLLNLLWLSLEERFKISPLWFSWTWFET